MYRNVKEGLLEYLQKEVLDKAQGTNKFLLYTGFALLTTRMDEMFHQYKNHPVLKALDIVKENDQIDVDCLYTAMKHAISKVGTFEIMGIIFNDHDVDALYSHIKTRD